MFCAFYNFVKPHRVEYINLLPKGFVYTYTHTSWNNEQQRSERQKSSAATLTSPVKQHASVPKCPGCHVNLFARQTVCQQSSFPHAEERRCLVKYHLTSPATKMSLAKHWSLKRLKSTVHGRSLFDASWLTECLLHSCTLFKPCLQTIPGVAIYIFLMLLPEYRQTFCHYSAVVFLQEEASLSWVRVVSAKPLFIGAESAASKLTGTWWHSESE